MVKPQILIVDDDPILLRVLGRLITRMDLRCATASDGEEAWQAIKRTMPDLVITDLYMPRMDGLSLIKRLRSISNTPPVIMLTSTLPCLQALKNVRGVPKPFQVGHLSQMIQKLVPGCCPLCVKCLHSV